MSDYGSPIPPEAVAVPAKRPPTLDGRLSDPQWMQAKPLQVNFNPFTLERSSLRTEARILYDETCLYVAFDCEDEDPWATMKVRDMPLWTEEVVEVFLDPDGKAQCYLELGVNPLNTRYDILLRVDRSSGAERRISDANWNIDGFVSRTRLYRGGWTVGIAIPFSSLTHWSAARPPRPGDVWRLQLGRAERPNRGDTVWLCWAPMASTFHQPERFGRLVFAK
ncbi:MAG: carbohydrate-binding family 9-like protein [Armatimonadota bacterium]